jgi:hypothetical protein
MDFGAAVLFLIFYFIRPHDWVPGLEGLNVMKILMVIGVFALASRREGFMPKGARTFLRSPVDWAIYAYFAYTICTAEEVMPTLTELFTYFCFYNLTAEALTSPRKIQQYLQWWLICLVTISLLAILTLVGVDITGAKAVTEAAKGRLCLRTWMLDNPNALGHTVVVGLPVAYFTFFWKQPFTKRILFLLISAACFKCVWETESKGAAIVGFISIALAWFFGKPKFVQIVGLTLVFLCGGAALKVMPRMAEISNAGRDEATLGRVMAWEKAHEVFDAKSTGMGFKQFESIIVWQRETISKPPHCSYVQIGADLGAPGLYLYLLIYVIALLVLTRLKGSSELMERNRRLIFGLLIAFMTSNWLIQRPYHMEFLLIMACTSVYYMQEMQERIKGSAQLVIARANRDKLAKEKATEAAEAAALVPEAPKKKRRAEQWKPGGITSEAPAPVIRQRVVPTFTEWVLGYGLYYIVVAAWEYVIKTF